ncbi:TonB-dependent receptor [Spirosoma endophyticum]|uniref:Iron complex outermembrane recepter protein n=1 Tax=Spirosoma endophyticum TaxID=662367 RepID=A0A1I1U0N1_9BACT|nr:TonB-dependent receptor [Spirosoma endophyticum]SFD64431.1 iron complex outermembrane recepter protein [Spirosoma endophyticum]
MKRKLRKHNVIPVVMLLFALVIISSTTAWAQSRKITGKVYTSITSEALQGVNVLVKGNSKKGATTDNKGIFSLEAEPNDVLVISFIGFKAQEIKVGDRTSFDIPLEENVNELTELIVTGTRNVGRTIIESPVPVDVISIKDIMGSLPQMDLAQMLAFVAPSFNAVRSQGGDLNSHVDPVQLRNMAPNQILVLVNGKRRHTSALLITETAVGSPSTTVDLMTIPVSAIDRVEILRDGAAAQYGSDAVAGVVNIILKKGTNKLTASLTGGGYANTGGQAGALTKSGKPDGFNYQFDANYGFKLSDKGYINISGQITQRRPTLRPFVNDWGFFDNTYLNNLRTDKAGNPVITNPELINAQVAGNTSLMTSLKTEDGLMSARGLTKADFAVYAGMPAITLGSTFYNAGYEINPTTTIYSFGGASYKYLEGFSCYFRRPAQTDRFNYLLYPNGFRPQMTSNTSDISNTVGIKSKIGNFSVDFSNTFGKNTMRLGMVNTFNASLGSNSPVNMNLGTHQFSQNSTNLDFSRYFKEVMNGLNIAFGAEMRVENYQIIKGQEESYSYGTAGILTVGKDGLLVGPDGKPLEDASSAPIVDANGNPLSVYAGQQVTVKSLSSNCQCFAGFGPKNERNEFRTTMAAYLDAELELTRKFLLAGAFRLENYSDFGGVTIAKLAARYSITKTLSLRGSFATGFRAPSLQELNYTHTATAFVPDANGIPQPLDVTTYPTNSTAARVLGIKGLKQEQSRTYGFGLTFQPTQGLEVTLDAYQIDVDNRIFRTSYFNASEVGNNYGEVIGDGEAQFFVNGADVRSKGLEAVGNYTLNLKGGQSLTFSLAAIFSKNTVLNRKTLNLNVANLSAEQVVGKYLSRDVVGQFETGTPRTKLIGSMAYRINKFNAMLRGTYYGSVTERSVSADNDGNFYDQTFSPQAIFDLSVGYDLNRSVKFSIGGSNIFDKYPQILRSENQGFYLYSNNQQGSNGAYYYGRVMFNF